MSDTVIVSREILLRTRQFLLAQLLELEGILGLTQEAETDTRHAMTFDDIKATAGLLRHKISNIGDDVKALKANAGTTAVNTAETLIDKGEVIANIQLAFRKLEDAQHRLSAAIQEIDGGKSEHVTAPQASRPLESNL